MDRLRRRAFCRSVTFVAVVVAAVALSGCRDASLDRVVEPQSTATQSHSSPTPTRADSSPAVNGSLSPPPTPTPLIVPTPAFAPVIAAAAGKLDVVTAAARADLVMAAEKPKLSFALGEEIFVLLQGQEPFWVGTGTAPTWSSDGRFLVWLRFEASDSADPSLGIPTGEAAVEVLDTSTGQRSTIREPERGFAMRVLPLAAHIAVLVNDDGGGANTTAFRLLDLTQVHDPAVGSTVRPDFVTPGGAAGELDQTRYDFLWQDAHGDHLYVQRTFHSRTWYRFSPQLWRLDADGRADFLFDECPAERDGCLSNFGFRSLRVSPNENFVVYEGGVRNGCEVYTSLVLTPIDAYKPVPLSGLPASDEISTLRVHQLEWIDPASFRVVASLSGLPGGDQRCTYPELAAPAAYLCTTVGDCTPDADQRLFQVRSSGGEVAVLEPEPDFSRSRLFTVRWADGTEVPIVADLGSLEWAPFEG